MDIRKILFVTKFEELWFDAVESLMDLRKAALEHVVFLNVIERDKVALRRGKGYQKVEEVRLKEMANIRFINWAETLFERGLEVGAYIVVGSLAKQVTSAVEKEDIDLIGEFITRPLCDIDAVNKVAAAWSRRGLVRGHICCFDIFGQPGCWQDACCLVGTQRMIMATFDDPSWVHTLLTILKERKLAFVRSLKGARYDILELGGGDASTTVISPRLFREFVAPYDGELIEAAHAADQRISYHTCGGMMPILEDIADMQPDAMETFTPVGMGGDVDLAEAKKRVGDRVCMIGGFDQCHFFSGCTVQDTKNEARRCFEAAGSGGGYIICPSDHFFEAT